MPLRSSLADGSPGDSTGVWIRLRNRLLTSVGSRFGRRPGESLLLWSRHAGPVKHNA